MISLRRHLRISPLRKAAAKAAMEWRQGCRLLEDGMMKEAAAGMRRCHETLSAGGAHALPLLVTGIMQVVESSRPDQRLLDIATFEIDRLSRGEIGPTLYLSSASGSLPARPEWGSREAAFFLPAIPADHWVIPSQTGKGEFSAQARRYRSEFQSLLVRLVRGDEEACGSVKTSLVSLENRRPPEGHGLPLTLAIAVMDIAIEGGVTQVIKALLPRIDIMLKSMGENEPIDSLLISRMMHAVASSRADSPRLRVIRADYGLTDLMDITTPEIILLPQWEVFDSAWMQAATVLNLWDEGHAADRKLSAAIRNMGTACGTGVNEGTIGRLCHSLEQVTLAMESGKLENDSAMRSHVAQSLARLQESMMSRSSRELSQVCREETISNDAVLRDGGLSFDIRIMETRAPQDAMAELSIDLSAMAEQVIEGSANIAMLNTARSVMAACGYPEGSFMARSLADAMDGGMAPPLASAALQRLASWCECAGDKESEEAIARSFAAILSAAKRGSQESDVLIDRDALEIFIEEARSVLGEVKAMACGHAPAGMRRAFHTLKGSSRMVGLDHLGRLMEKIEAFLQEAEVTGKPISERMLAFGIRWAGFAVESAETVAGHGSVVIDDSLLEADMREGWGSSSRVIDLGAAFSDIEPIMAPSAPSIPHSRDLKELLQSIAETAEECEAALGRLTRGMVELGATAMPGGLQSAKEAATDIGSLVMRMGDEARLARRLHSAGQVTPEREDP